MSTGQLKIEIRGHVRSYCKWRGDNQAHYEACLRDIWQHTESDWPWFRDYFKSALFVPERREWS